MSQTTTPTDDGTAADTDRHPAAQEVLSRVDDMDLIGELEGRDGFRVSKPDANGLIQYVWRYGMFHSGRNTSMPVTANMWLQSYLDEQGIDASVSGIKDDAGDAVIDLLEKVVKVVLNHFGESQTAGARRWKGLVF